MRSLVYACRYRFYYNTRSKVGARYYTRSGRPCWQCYCSKLRLVGTMDLHKLIPDRWLDFDELNELFDNQPTGAALSEKDDMLASQQNEANTENTETDSLMLLASQQYEVQVGATMESAPASTSRFGAPVTGDSINQLVTARIPGKTRKTTQWAMNVWREWAVFRLSSPMHGEEATQRLNDDFLSMCASDQSFWLCRFVCEAAKKIQTHIHQIHFIRYVVD